eukprot:12909674-Prorocentrum_lima.AAC.1
MAQAQVNNSSTDSDSGSEGNHAVIVVAAATAVPGGAGHASLGACSAWTGPATAPGSSTALVPRLLQAA